MEHPRPLPPAHPRNLYINFSPMRTFADAINIEESWRVIAEWHVKEGANYHQGLVLCKRACGSCCDKCGCVHQALLATMRLVLAMLASPPRNQTRKCP
ncbi:hypothetical protein GBA52_029056 [Prunus armeniaca]|nr:hypothetical protein GBA52_029056 [Prunus armeniaca]